MGKFEVSVKSEFTGSFFCLVSSHFLNLYGQIHLLFTYMHINLSLDNVFDIWNKNNICATMLIRTTLKYLELQYLICRTVARCETRGPPDVRSRDRPPTKWKPSVGSMPKYFISSVYLVLTLSDAWQINHQNIIIRVIKHKNCCKIIAKHIFLTDNNNNYTNKNNNNNKGF